MCNLIKQSFKQNINMSLARILKEACQIVAFDQLNYPICEICSKKKRGCCLEQVCNNLQDFICYSCQNNCHESIHFLHEIIELNSFFKDVTINHEIKKIYKFQRKIQQELTHLRTLHRGSIFGESSKFTIFINKLIYHQMNTRSIYTKRKNMYNLLKTSCVKLQNLTPLLPQIQQQLVNLRSLELELCDQEITAMVINIIELTKRYRRYEEIFKDLLQDYFNLIKKIQVKKHSFYNKKIMQEESKIKTFINNTQPKIVYTTTRELIFQYYSNFDFNSLPKQITRVILIFNIPIYQIIRSIVNTSNIQQLHIQVDRDINRQILKKIYGQILSKNNSKLRSLTVVSNKLDIFSNPYEFGLNSNILLRRTYIQAQMMHLSKLCKKKRSLRCQILEMFQ